MLFGEISKKGLNCAKMISFVVFVTTIRLKILLKYSLGKIAYFSSHPKYDNVFFVFESVEQFKLIDKIFKLCSKEPLSNSLKQRHKNIISGLH